VGLAGGREGGGGGACEGGRGTVMSAELAGGGGGGGEGWRGQSGHTAAVDTEVGQAFPEVWRGGWG
jgi:hypothetical protein